MNYYITYGEFQAHLKEHYLRTGKGMQFPEMTEYLYRKGLLSPEPLPPVSISAISGPLEDEAFNRIVDTIPLTLTVGRTHGSLVPEGDIFPHAKDVFLIRHPRYTRVSLHRHDYFEIDFVASGSCRFYFEKTSRTLQSGELCIIAPSSEHDLFIGDDSTVFSIMLRKSTFETTFFSLLSRRDLLSYFFRTILQRDSHANYLLFYGENNAWLKQIIHNAMGESYKNDSYSNVSCISWINLLFTQLLRSYSKTLQFYHFQMGADFSLVLQYVQHNYQRLTLASLAELFHYSEPHLSTLFKQNTGHSFSQLIRRLRMGDAVEYLLHSDLKISEIAERVGYHSADHFSRVFRSTYHTSPQAYRKKHGDLRKPLLPFKDTPVQNPSE